MKSLIIALHGFLGRPQDWGSHNVEALDYWNIPGLGPDVSLNGWGKNFNNYICQRYPNQKLELIGYSLGGRLAMHAVRENPKIWSSLKMISANPGLTSDLERQERLLSDQNWADKFLSMPWAEIIGQWNAQAVFQSSFEPERFEKNYDRAQIAKALTNWSIGHQEDFRPWISQTEAKITWITGQKDKKYSGLVDQLVVGKNQEKIKISNAGHRLIFEKNIF